MLDISTGSLLSNKILKNVNTLGNQIVKYQIKEIVLKDNTNANLINELKNKYNVDIDICPYELDKINSLNLSFR